MNAGLRNYLIITGGYWAFTLTDGAIRMLVVLYFYLLGYSPLEVASLFIFYEFFGIVTNLLGGWLASRLGLNITLHAGMALQVFALIMLMAPEPYLSVFYVMLAQAFSGIAKDLNKMSAKASIKTFLPSQQNQQQEESQLFKWIAILTGSKNALKGAGFFLGAFLLQTFEFRGALATLAGSLFIILLLSISLLPRGLGTTKSKIKFQQIFSKTKAINYLSAARLFLFAARDIWFVVALPVYLIEVLSWEFVQVGSFLAFWIIGYGIVQACTPQIIRRHNNAADKNSAVLWAFILSFFPAGIAIALSLNFPAQLVLLSGLFGFGFVFAINSAIHSYLIVSWSAADKVATNVGFYYMANAAGRLSGTLLSGWIYQIQGLIACLIVSSIFILIAALLSIKLPSTHSSQLSEH